MATQNSINSTNVNHNIIVGTGSAYTSTAPSATSGVPLISQGSSANPIYGTAAIAGGGTNATSFTQSNGIVTYNGTSLVNYAGPQIDSTGRQTNTTQPAFSASVSNDTTNATGDGTLFTIPADRVIFNQGSYYNNSTYTFTAPVTGTYFVHVNAAISNLAAGHTAGTVYVITSNSNYAATRLNTFIVNPGSGVEITSGSWIADMDAGDTMTGAVVVSGSTKTVTVNSTIVGTFNCGIQAALIC